MKRCWCGCERPLQGRQRKFSSDACRMRYNRHGPSEEVRKPPGNVPDLFGSYGDLFASGLTNRKFTVRFTVELLNDKPLGQFDYAIINKAIRLKLGQMLAEYLQRERPEFKVRVTVEAKMIDS